MAFVDQSAKKSSFKKRHSTHASPYKLSSAVKKQSKPPLGKMANGMVPISSDQIEFLENLYKSGENAERDSAMRLVEADKSPIASSVSSDRPRSPSIKFTDDRMNMTDLRRQANELLALQKELELNKTPSSNDPEEIEAAEEAIVE